MGAGGGKGKGPLKGSNPPRHPHLDNWEELYGKLCEKDALSDILFEKHFSSPLSHLTNNLYDQFFVDLVNPVQETKTMFIERCHHITNNITDILNDEQIHFLLDLVGTKSAEMNATELRKVIKTFCLFGIHQHSLSNGEDSITEAQIEIQDDDRLISCIANTILTGNDVILKTDVVEWIRCNCRKMVIGVQSWLEHKFLGNISRSVTGFIPQPGECSSSSSALLLTSSCLWYLCCVLPSCYTYMENKFKSETTAEEEEGEGGNDQQLFTWNLLFNSNQHGLSLNRFKHRVLDYKSPTVTLIEFSGGVTIALALDEKWVDSPEKYGGTYCQLLELSPTVDEIESGPKIVYLKESGRSIPTGLLIGSSDTKPKIKLSTDLNTADLNYKGEYNDQVERMEVWGCGGVRALKSQQDLKKWEAKEVERRKKVKLPGQWDADKSILEMGGVCVDHSQRGDI